MLVYHHDSAAIHLGSVDGLAVMVQDSARSIPFENKYQPLFSIPHRTPQENEEEEDVDAICVHVGEDIALGKRKFEPSFGISSESAGCMPKV